MFKRSTGPLPGESPPVRVDSWQWVSNSYNHFVCGADIGGLVPVYVRVQYRFVGNDQVEGFISCLTL